jgi:hypothetical protein
MILNSKQGQTGEIENKLIKTGGNPLIFSMKAVSTRILVCSY